MTNPVQRRGGPLPLILAAVLFINSLIQVAGGAMMILRPERIASETFGISNLREAAPLMAVIGGATLGYALLSATAAVGAFQRRTWAWLPITLLGMMLIAVCAAMLGQGLRIGNLDLAKGVVFLVGGLAYAAALERGPIG